MHRIEVRNKIGLKRWRRRLRRWCSLPNRMATTQRRPTGDSCWLFDVFVCFVVHKMPLLRFEINLELNPKKMKLKNKVEPCCEQIVVWKSEQRIPPTSCQGRYRVPKQKLVGLWYSYLIVDTTTTNCTEAWQLLNCITGHWARVMRRLSDRWLRKSGCLKGGYELVSYILNTQ